MKKAAETRQERFKLILARIRARRVGKKKYIESDMNSYLRKVTGNIKPGAVIPLTHGEFEAMLAIRGGK